MLTYEKLLAKVEQLEKLNKWYEEQLKLNRKKMFGASSERSDMDQLNLFNESEAEAQAISHEPTIEEITYKRKKQKGGREKLLADLPVETIEYTIEDANCPKCNNELYVMSRKYAENLKLFLLRFRWLNMLTLFILAGIAKKLILILL